MWDKYLLDNVFNNHWTICPIIMSEWDKICHHKSNIFSSKFHFVQPKMFCPVPAVPAGPTFCSPGQDGQCCGCSGDLHNWEEPRGDLCSRGDCEENGWISLLLPLKSSRRRDPGLYHAVWTAGSASFTSWAGNNEEAETGTYGEPCSGISSVPE